MSKMSGRSKEYYLRVFSLKGISWGSLRDSSLREWFLYLLCQCPAVWWQPQPAGMLDCFPSWPPPSHTLVSDISWIQSPWSSDVRTTHFSRSSIGLWFYRNYSTKSFRCSVAFAGGTFCNFTFCAQIWVRNSVIYTLTSDLNLGLRLKGSSTVTVSLKLNLLTKRES